MMGSSGSGDNPRVHTGAAGTSDTERGGGAFAERWIDGTRADEAETHTHADEAQTQTHADEAETQTQRFDGDTYVIRQSLHTNFEGNFLFLLFGEERALLLDTGAGGLQIRPVVDAAMASGFESGGATGFRWWWRIRMAMTITRWEIRSFSVGRTRRSSA